MPGTWSRQRICRVLGQARNFHEITDNAVAEAFAHPRTINMDLVNAQQARRIIDRLVGYKVSGLLRQKARRGLTAGRVQSIALRLVVEREKEIQAFLPVEYWTIDALLGKQQANSGANEFKAGLIRLTARHWLVTAKIWKRPRQWPSAIKRLHASLGRTAKLAVPGLGGQTGHTAEAALATIHHQYAAAGSFQSSWFQRAQNHANRTTALRRHKHWRWQKRRIDYLYAHRQSNRLEASYLQRPQLCA